MRAQRHSKKGSVIVMVTLALVMLCGILGLAVDLGWAFYVKKSAQAAADAAALAAVSAAYAKAGQEGPYDCSNLACTGNSAYTCPATVTISSNLDNGCAYAARNGFPEGGRKHVTVEADAGSAPPTLPGVNVYYWATARAGESIPQLFSAVLGNLVLNSSSRATAAIVDSGMHASLLALNRVNDPGPGGPGVDITGGGGGQIIGGEGIWLSSEAHGIGGNYAGELQGNTAVTAPMTLIKGAGSIDLGGTASWQAAPENGIQDDSYFLDPMRDLGQPPPSKLGLTDRWIDGNVIAGSNDPDNPTVLPAGNYYATGVDKKGQRYATGEPVQVTGNVRFEGGSFGDWVFFGGVSFQQNSKAVFGPGRYIFAGAQQQGGNPGTVFGFSTGVTLTDGTPLGSNGSAQPNADAGEIFVFTDAKYAPYDPSTRSTTPLQLPPMVAAIRDNLRFGTAEIQAGVADDSTLINLHGLQGDPGAGGYQNVPSELRSFRPVVFWQDQANSTVKYTPDGNIDCGQLSGSGPCSSPYSLDDPKRTGIANGSPEMLLQATPRTNIYGLIYQPRGAYLTLQGSGKLSTEEFQTPLQVITGALNVQGGPNVSLNRLNNGFRRKIVALVR